jgi:hypothetical protein
MIHNLLINSAIADHSGQISSIGRLVGASASLVAAELACSLQKPMLVLANDTRHEPGKCPGEFWRATINCCSYRRATNFALGVRWFCHLLRA